MIGKSLTYEVPTLFGAAVLVCVLTACSTVGPAAITTGRGAYSEAIGVTGDRQVLSHIVGTRYLEQTALLSVSSVTANLNVTASASSQIGIGSKESYEGNIVPLSLGFAYEENPTITYTPVQGEKYIRQLLSPLPLDLTILVHSAARSMGAAMTTLLRSVNSLRNPDFLTPPGTQPDPRFTRVVELVDELAAAGSLRFVQSTEGSSRFALALFGYAPERVDQVRELTALLGVPKAGVSGADIVIPVHSCIEGRGLKGLALETRSVHDLLRIAAAAIEIPQEDRTSGAADSYPPLGAVGDYVRIHHARQRPANAAVAVKHKGWWFYIDETDLSSKRFFRLIELLMGARIADAGRGQQLAPLLTIPATR